MKNCNRRPFLQGRLVIARKMQKRGTSFLNLSVDNIKMTLEIYTEVEIKPIVGRYFINREWMRINH
jgi:hypothetical protein